MTASWAVVSPEERVIRGDLGQATELCRVLEGDAEWGLYFPASAIYKLWGRDLGALNRCSSLIRRASLGLLGFGASGCASGTQ